MKANEYKTLMRAVDDGLRAGLHQYMKHRDTGPDLTKEGEREYLAESISDVVVMEICEWFDFEGIPDDVA